MAKKSKGKKKVKKIKKQKKSSIPVRHEVVVRVAPQVHVPTTEELAQPIKADGGELALPKTWLSDKQILRMVQGTPPRFIYERPGKGGQKWKYVSGGYVEKVLNFVFGFMWDFDVLEHGMVGDFIWVKGRLTVKDPKGNTITKTQFGRKEIAYKTEVGRDGKRIQMDHTPENMLDYGNDLKAASTDSMKKCASMLGIASDIYAPNEYREESGQKPQDRNQSAPPALPPAAPASTERIEPIYCHGSGKSGCPSGAELTESEAKFSMDRYGKLLCRDCQKFATPKKK